MIIKILLCTAVCGLCYFFGKSISDGYLNKIRYAEEIILKLERLKNDVEYSSINVSMQIFDEKYGNDVEKFCTEELKNMVCQTENCNSIKGVMNIIGNSVSILTEYKNKKWEEYRNKIVSVPKLSLLAGMFVSILII